LEPPAASHHKFDGQLDERRNGADAAVLATQVGDRPAAGALLEVVDGEADRFAAAQAAAY